VNAEGVGLAGPNGEQPHVIAKKSVLTPSDPQGLVRLVTWSPDGRLLAVTTSEGSSSGGDTSVVLLERNGNVIRRIRDASDVAFSPDGTRMVVLANDKLLLYSVRDSAAAPTTLNTGAKAQNIFGPPSLSWAPEGDRIAFNGQSSDGMGLFTVDSDGSNTRFLLQISNGSFPMRWGPNRRLLLAPGDAESSGVVVVTDGPAPSPVTLASARYPTSFFAPDWSLDGNRVTYTRRQASPCGHLSQGCVSPVPHVVIQDATPSASPRDIGPDGGRNAQWTASGRLLFVFEQSGAPAVPALMRPDGSGLTKLDGLNSIEVLAAPRDP